MNNLKRYLNYLNECECEYDASDYNEVTTGEEPKPIEKAKKDIEDEILDEDKKWIQKAIEKPGSLHRALGVPEGEKIPAKKLQVKPGDYTLLKRRKILAKTLRKIRKK